MEIKNKPRFYQLVITTILSISGIFANTNQTALAQITPDNTLGTENSVVNSINEMKDIINGGATRGTNLFHSFQQFNVGENRSVYFANPLGIHNILTRVTGNDASHILGTLGVEGTANLFLINPNGIVFGENASLDIRGSFTVTTADSIQLGEDGLFSAKNPQSSNLLTIQPGALFRNAIQNQQAEIRNEANLIVENSKNITLFGANVINTGTLIAPEGKINLTGTENLIVRGNLQTGTLLLDTQNFVLTDEFINDNNATIYRKTLEELSGDTNLILQATNNFTIHPLYTYLLELNRGNGEVRFTADYDGDGIGNFQMDTVDTINTNGRNISISGANLTLGNIDTSFVQDGNIIAVVDVNNGGVIPPDGISGTSTFTFTVSESENIENLDVQFSAAHTWNDDLTATLTSPSGTRLELFNRVGGDGDNFQDTLLDDNATNFINNQNSVSPPFAGKLKPAGTGGLAIFNGENSQGNWQLQVTDCCAGDTGILYQAGEIAPWGTANGTQLIFRNSLISESGSVTLNATHGNINVGNINTENLTDVGGTVNLLATENINLNNSSLKAGENLFLQANNAILIDNNSVISTIAYGNRNTGDISITTNTLDILNNSFLDVSTFENGNAGNVNITATDSIKFENGSFVFSQVNSGGDGVAGSVNISTKSLELLNSSFIFATTVGKGNAGNIKITATDNIKFDGRSVASSRVLSGAEGNAGGIEISTHALELLNASALDATTLGTGDAGTIKITVTDSLIINNNSGVTSQVESSSVGTTDGVDISTNSLAVLNSSSISASTNGKGNAGSIKITAIDNIKFDGGSFAASRVLSGAEGKSGGIEISTHSLELLGDSDLNVSTNGIGNAGSIKITATDNIKFDGDSSASSQVLLDAKGNSGGIEISAHSLELLGASRLDTGTFGKGDAGSVKITASDSIIFDAISIVATGIAPGGEGNAGGVNISTHSLQLFNGSGLDASTFGKGDAGIVKITASDSIIFDDGVRVASRVGPDGEGNAGGVEISSKSLELLNGSRISASTFAQGNAGSVKITASDFIKFDSNSRASSRVEPDGIGNAGGIEIFTQNLQLLNDSFLSASTFAQGNAGTIKITATDAIKFENGSFAASGVEPEGRGKAGGLEISTRFLELLNSSVLSASTLGIGDAGTLKITATDAIKFNDSSVASLVSLDAEGEAGGVEISSKSLELVNGSRISASTLGKGNAGNVKITSTDFIKFDNSGATSSVGREGIGNASGVEVVSKSLELSSLSFLSSSTLGKGNAGTVKITAADFIKFSGESFADSQVNSGAIGKAGDVDISTNSLELSGLSYLSASTLGKGNAGTIKITAADFIKFDQGFVGSLVGERILGNAGGVEIFTNSLELSNNSEVTASIFGEGNSGTIQITANSLTANTGGKILTTTSSNSQAGNINLIVKDNITLDGTKTGIFANTELGSTGDSGSITIDPQTFIIRNGAGIGVNSQGTGEGGNISLQAGTLILDNQGFITGETASNQGGEINLNLQDLLLLRNNSRITATAGTDGAGGDGGNININSPLVVAFPTENSDITANAFTGNGGKTQITTNGIFGLEFRPQLTPKSDITASSQFGLAGEVEINTPDVDPTSGLIELPTNLVDATNQLYQGCRRSSKDNSFTVIGRGGLPSHPDDLFTGTTPLIDLVDTVDMNTKTNSTINLERINNSNPVIQEAQGWMITGDGRVFLTAKSPKVVLQNTGLNHPSCYADNYK